VTKRLVQKPHPITGELTRLGNQAGGLIDYNIFVRNAARQSDDFGKSVVRYEFTSMLNQGEEIRVVLDDPSFDIITPLISEQYYKYSKLYAPLEIETRVGYINSDLWITKQNHALVSVQPYLPEDNTDRGSVEFVAVDYPSFWLSAGDAAGKAWKGNVKQAIEQVVDEYGGDVSLEFRGDTNDSTFNTWHQNRLDPKTFIQSLLEWSPAINKKQTRWFQYPDDRKLIIAEQAGIEPIHRSSYEYRGWGYGQPGGGDIVNWELIGNNSLQLSAHKLVTSGMSSVSGEYYDWIDHEDEVLVGDGETPNKYGPKTDKKKSYRRSTDDPQPKGAYAVGWTHIPSIPEHNAGDLGLKYDDYISGRPRSIYLSLVNLTLRCKFTILGHYIWSGSEGLGADTIDLSALTAKNTSQFLAGNWIVYGFHHVATAAGWLTDLYCMRLDADATARKVGK